MVIPRSLSVVMVPLPPTSISTRSPRSCSWCSRRASGGSCGGASRDQLALERERPQIEAALDAAIGDVSPQPSWRSVRSSPGVANHAGCARSRATGAAQVEVYWRTVTMATPSAARSAEAEYRRRAARRRSITMDSLRRRRSPWRRSEITSTSGRPAKCRDRYPWSAPSGRATMKRSRESRESIRLAARAAGTDPAWEAALLTRIREAIYVPTPSG